MVARNALPFTVINSKTISQYHIAQYTVKHCAFTKIAYSVDLS
uniref:Uncharacterized protein n=1 Tax=Anguilla anguilla TaxID=7936 RepID=A0A0E9QHQ4_ANGAN